MIRRQIAFVVAAAMILSLAGCWSRVEVNDLAIATMVGFDRTPKGDIQIWLQVVIPVKAGRAPEGGGGGQGLPFVTVSATGRTVLEASKMLQLELPRRIFWAHARVFLVGEDLARAGLRPVLDFLTRHREIRLNGYILAVRGNIAQVMATPVDLEKLPADHLREIMRTRYGTVVNLAEFIRLLSSRGADPVMGAVTVSPPPAGAPRGQRPALRLAGTAVFRGDKLVGFLDERITRGLLWLRGRVTSGVVVVPAPGASGLVSVEWVLTHIKRTAWLRGDQVVIHLQARAEGDIGETLADLDLDDPAVSEQIEEAVQREIHLRMEEALERTRALNADAAALGEVVHEQLPQVWQQLEPDWLGDAFHRVAVEIAVETHVRRTGASIRPMEIPAPD